MAETATKLPKVQLPVINLNLDVTKERNVNTEATPQRKNTNVLKGAEILSNDLGSVLSEIADQFEKSPEPELPDDLSVPMFQTPKMRHNKTSYEPTICLETPRLMTEHKKLRNEVVVSRGNLESFQDESDREHAQLPTLTSCRKSTDVSMVSFSDQKSLMKHPKSNGPVELAPAKVDSNLYSTANKLQKLKRREKRAVNQNGDLFSDLEDETIQVKPVVKKLRFKF